MQESPLSHLTRDLIFQRAELVGQLLHMDDALLDAKAPNDEWSIREHVEHVLYWENNSMMQVASEMKAQAGSGRGWGFRMTNSTNRYDVAVVGLGAMGSAAAWHLARRGQRVIGFDRFRPPHMFGSTHGDTRGIREAYYEGPSYVPFVRRAYELWDELSDLVGKPLFTQTGALSLGTEDAGLVQGVLTSAREHDIPVDYMDAAELRRRYPGIAAHDGLVGVLEQRGGMIEIEPALNGQLDQAARHGAELHFDEPVEKWLPSEMDDLESPIVINTAKGQYEAERMIVTAGAWNAGLVGKLNLPLTVTRQVMFWFEPRANPEAFEVGALPFWMWERGVQDFAYGFPNVGKGFKLGHHQPLDESRPERLQPRADRGRRGQRALVAGADLPGRGRQAAAGGDVHVHAHARRELPDRHSPEAAEHRAGQSVLGARLQIRAGDR